VSRRHKGSESESFAGRVARLVDELKLAIEWNRPSILFAIYQSHFVMENAQNALAVQLRALGQGVERYVVTRENADIPLILSHHPERERTVFFVQGLQFGGEAAVRALNIRREYFVEKSIRAVFWLTEYEATAVAHSAPDFWAFRHRSVDFIDVPESQLTAESNKDLAWTSPESRTPLKDMDAKIALRQRLLADLAQTAETLGARAELQSTLGALYSAKGEHESAIPYWQQAIENKELLGDARGLALAYGGLANAYAGLGRFDEAEHVYGQSIKLAPRLAINYSALGNLYAELGRDEEAITAYKKATELDPGSPDPHLGLGNAAARIGRYDEAVREYRLAVELDPTSVAARNRLGSLYLRQGAPEKAQAEFEAGMSADEKDWQAPFNLGLVRLRQGQPAQARALWEKATTLCRRGNLTESLGRALLDAATGQSERGLVEMRGILSRRNLPSGTLAAVLRDAEMLASAPNPPRQIGDMIELLRERIAQVSEIAAGKPIE
jgi:tetratricopeptide (TPR) repeat protein